MSIFNGNNRLKSLKDLFVEKSKFLTQAHEKEGPEVFEHLFLENILYGTIDTNGSAIYPKQEEIGYFSDNTNSISEFKAFKSLNAIYLDIRRNMQFSISLGQSANDNANLSKMKITRAYEPPIGIYKNYLASILTDFNTMIVNNPSISINITHFEQYVKEFLVFLKTNHSQKPITLSGWLVSSENSIFSTGLAVSIADIAFDDDNAKYDEFMNSSLFDFYKDICRNRGAYVWKHCPYVMIMDIGSPAFSRRNGGITSGAFIERFYNKAYKIDYKLLYRNIINYYNLLVDQKQYEIVLKSKSKNCTLKEIYYRPTQSTTDIDDLYWMNYYLDVRNCELGYPLGDAEVLRIKKYLKNMMNSLDKDELTGYIDSNFRNEIFKLPYGTYDSWRRYQERTRQQELQEGITSGNTILGGSSGGY
tara:strand:- start:10685 stop:11938 length:1254 start_codon:yes stop_codon:yes gene_type:complete